MAPGTDDDFPEPWRDDPGRSEARHHGRERDSGNTPDWQEDENYADEVPFRRHREPAYAGPGISWTGIVLGLIIIIILVALIVYFISR
jgi:hypothetical protein